MARYALLLLLAAPALAKTPDGKPPSVEDVCDGYKGAAYGQCNSYCEARDCDDPRVHAADRSCAVTAAKFTALTGDDLPCAPAAPACTVDAIDDASSASDYNLLSNDTTSSTDPLTVAWYDAPPDVTVDAKGGYVIDWPADETDYVRVFTYTICCDATTCDTATATLSSPRG